MNRRVSSAWRVVAAGLLALAASGLAGCRGVSLDAMRRDFVALEYCRDARTALDERPVDRPKARRAIDRAVTLAPENATVVATAPEVYLALGDHAAAWKALQRQALPDSMLLGQCLLRLGRERDAVALLKGGVAEARALSGRGALPEFAYAMQMNNAGYVLADAGVELEAAEDYLEAAVAMLPTDPNCADSLGWLRFRQGRFREAVFWLERAVRLSPQPGHAEVLCHLGTAYARSGNRARAAKLLLRSLAQDPGLEPALGELKRIRWRLPEPEVAATRSPLGGGHAG